MLLKKNVIFYNGKLYERNVDKAKILLLREFSQYSAVDLNIYLNQCFDDELPTVFLSRLVIISKEMLILVYSLKSASVWSEK